MNSSALTFCWLMLFAFFLHLVKHHQTTQSRWARGRSKERGRKSPGSGTLLDDDRDGSDYAADNSDSSVTPFESPRHRAATLTDSPLARPRNNNNNINDSPLSHRHVLTTKASLTGMDCEPSTSYLSSNHQAAFDVIHVSWAPILAWYWVLILLSVLFFSVRRSHSTSRESATSTFIFPIKSAFS